LRRSITFIASLTLLFAALAPVKAEESRSFRSGTSYASITTDEIVLGNDKVQRSWSRTPFQTTSITDKRAGGREWGGTQRDFSLVIGGQKLGSESFSVEAATVQKTASGLRLSMHLVAPGIRVTRVAQVYSDVAGFKMSTTIESSVPLALAGYSLDEARVGTAVTPTIHAFRAGADWREPDWAGPPLQIGDPHAGTWRNSTSAAAGADLKGAAQWVTVADGDRSLFMVMERNDFPSSIGSYEGGVVSTEVDFSRDVISLGPLEENGHIENPSPSPGRHRLVVPGTPYEMESSFIGFGDHAGDEPWQFHKYLVRHRLTAYDMDITFNSNGTDSNVISTGAKDDMNIATVRQAAPIARALGVETFILDDGWQARSGDWQPDSPQFPEPRWDGVPGSKFAPRFPDPDFVAVREAIAPMKLGLWMSPMHFNPNSATYQAHPEWGCKPTGQATAVVNALQPDSSSNEAGIGTWGPDAIPHVERRLRDAIENWKVEYFKFDFLVWLDCAGQGDMHDYHDAFVDMMDRLQDDYPQVTFQIDETNDYRLFPFESVSRGPSWFQNGSPEVNQLLHNLWNLSPYVPTFSLGQHFLGGRAWERYPVDTIMAASLPSHLTFFSDLRSVPAGVIDQARPWTDFYKARRELFTQLLYPLVADPLDLGWTALQSWDPEKGQGALLVFRQNATEDTHTIALENVPPSRTFKLLSGPSETLVGTFTSQQLTDGIDVTIPNQNGAVVYLVLPA
jgi:Melibiase